MNEIVEEETYPGVKEEKLSIEVTTHCNSACLHCFAHAGISMRSSLSVGLVKEIIAEGYDTGYRHLHITGGEPLLWEGLFEALDYSVGMGYKTVLMNTNGTPITKDISRKLAGYDGLSISVSLEGPEALHDRIRGESSYRRTIGGIERALDAGVDLAIYTTVRRSLLSELPYFTDSLYKKFPSINYLMLIQLIRVTDGPFVLMEELLEPEDFLRLVRTVALLNHYGLLSVVKKNPLVNVVSKLIEMPWIPHVPPLYTYGSMIVLANRDISVVHSSRDRFGKYKPGMIQRVLMSDVYRMVVALDETTCLSCGYFELCRKNGMVRPSEGCRDMHDDTPYCKRVLDRLTGFHPVSGGNPERREVGLCR
jgi:MoaA/NifB/PqqE/SkfB family radical SAM enzyme